MPFLTFIFSDGRKQRHRGEKISATLEAGFCFLTLIPVQFSTDGCSQTRWQE
jgi:hypothetical protein